VLCGVASLLASLPSFLSLLVRPSQQGLVVGFATISMSFYMFSYHVHEKSILLPLLLVPLLGEVVGGALAHDLIVAGCLGTPAST
jgi:alpha-1,3-glucosyltransferase